MIRSKISSVGSYLPERVWKNDDLKSLMDTSDEWIFQRTGIRERHWVDLNSATGTSDLAFEAAKIAIERAGIKKEEIDLILLATLSPDHEFPGTACFLQAKLGLSGMPAIDVRQQCSGFIYALSIADAMIRSGQAKKALVVGAEVHSKGLDLTNNGRDVSVLFGDGAGAVILEAFDSKDSKKESCILSTHLYADGNYAKELWVPALGSAYPGNRYSPELIENRDIYPKMNGKAVFLNAVKRIPEAILVALKQNEYQIEDVDLFVLHQANIRINEHVATQLKIPPEKVFNTIDRFGNTTAATIPLGLDEALKAGKLKKGMLVCSATFGSGFTWSSALYRW